MTIPLETYLTNITAMQLSCGVTNADGMQAFKSNLETTDVLPYWTNVVARIDPVQIAQPSTWNYAITIVMRLHRGKMTEGFDGQIGAQIADDMSRVIPYFAGRNMSLQVNPKAQPVNGFRGNARITSGVWQIFPGDISETIGSLYTLEFSCIDDASR